MATINVEAGGRPFGAVITLNGNIIAEAVNTALRSHDPTAHAEMQVIRAAAHFLQAERLAETMLVSSCEPCVMCSAAIAWAGIETTVYAVGREDAARFGFADVVPPAISRAILGHRALRLVEDAEEALVPFRIWRQRQIDQRQK